MKPLAPTGIGTRKNGKSITNEALQTNALSCELFTANALKMSKEDYRTFQYADLI
jgi:glycogen debranching enzyme